jgi:Protein of unknown function (DUF2752)
VPAAGETHRLAGWSSRLAPGALLMGAVLLVAAVDPHTAGRYPVCPWLAMTGTFCPGCGGLRAVHDLAHGQVAAAVGENVLVVALVPLLALWWLSGRFGARFGHPRKLLSTRVVVVAAVVVLAFAVLRNLPAGAALAP